MPRLTAARRASRRAEILAAAESCFSRMGFHRATMRDIIAEGGLSAGGVYKHFASKDEIVAAIITERHAREAEALARAGRDADPFDALRALARKFINDLATPEGVAERRVGVQIWAEALLDENLRGRAIEGVGLPVAQIAKLIARAQADGRLMKSAAPEALARSFVALFHGYVLQKLWQPELDPAAYLHALDMILEGLTIPASGGRRK